MVWGTRPGWPSSASAAQEQGREPCSPSVVAVGKEVEGGEDRGAPRPRRRWSRRRRRRRKRDGEDQQARVRGGGRQRPTLWHSATETARGHWPGARPVQYCGYLKTRGATRMCHTSSRRVANLGNLDRQTTLVNVMSRQHEGSLCKKDRGAKMK